MPWGLKRFHQTGALHFITWSCEDRQPLLNSSGNRDLLLRVLEQMRNRYRFALVGFVVMPEHVHLLISEPLIGNTSSAICAVKIGFTRRILSRNPHLWQHRREAGHPRSDGGQHFWMKRYYDFNVYSESKISETLHYMHQNPVARGLVEHPEDWEWSSFRSYASGDNGIVKLNDWSWWEERIRSLGVS
jgi:REP-associated tyrosine transposase